MSFAFFYFIALIPVIAGGLLWYFNSRYTWWEWLITSTVAFSVAGVCYLVAIKGMIADEETWSGKVASLYYRPTWTERWKEAIYKNQTVGTGKNRHTVRVFSHYETRYTTYPDTWTAITTLGYYEISKGHYDNIAKNFGGVVVPKAGTRSTFHTGSTFISGDPNDYTVDNKTNFIEPLQKGVLFENRVKAAPSVFSYQVLSEEESAKYPNYPYPTDTWVSQRVISAPVSIRLWDEMNAEVGPAKKVNLILVQLPSPDAARKLEAKWVGGKKNDLVLCYGDGWSRVFGWCESRITQRNLETLLLENKVDDSIIPVIKKEVMSTYVPMDWTKFDYLDIQPRPIHFLILILVMILTQAGCTWFALANDADKEIYGF